MSKRAVVLGGAGLIGSHLCVKLLEEGYDVVCVDRRGLRESPLLRKIDNRGKFHYVKHDITTPFEIVGDELYNLVSPTEYGTNCDYIEDQYLISTGSMNALHLATRGYSKVIYGSSDDVYNFEKLDIEYNSNKRFIAETKRFGESIHKAYHQKYQLDCRIARIFSTYGSNAGLRDQHVIGKMIVNALNNQDIKIFGNGEQVRTFCWVEDMADGLYRLMNAHTADRLITADLGSNTQISIRELAELIISLTGSKSNIQHVSARKDEPRYKIPNLKVATSQLYWEPTTSMHEGLMRTISYIEKELSSIAMSQMSWVEIYG